MARILISIRNGWRRPDDFNAMPPFYETFLKGLQNAGNEVFCFQHKEYSRNFSTPIPEDMKRMIRSFDPELCILFNNTFWDISDLVDCPILIYDVDSPIEYTHKDNLEANPSRYKFIINQKQGAELMKETFNAPDENIFYVPFFTEVHKNDSAELRKNIVFLGSNWTWHGYNFLQDFLKKNPNESDVRSALEVLNRFSEDPYHDSKELYWQLGYHPQKPLVISDMRRAAYEVSGIYRMKVLSAIADLGLEIRGQYWGIDCMNYFPEIMASVNKTPTYSKQENEDFYNGAKISINTQHIQTVSGFSFRVCDIMASNACLVTSPSKDLKELFPQIPIPMYESPYEAREICKKLLENENMRSDIVCACQEAIDHGYRIRDVIARIEQISGVSLDNGASSNVCVKYGLDVGKLEIYSDEDPSMRKPTIISSAPVLVPPLKKAKPAKKSIPAATTTSSDSSSAAKGDGLNPICRLWYKTLGKHLGYDPYNRFNKKTVYLGKLLLFERLKPNPNREETYFIFFPLLSKTRQGDKTVVRLLLFEKIGNALRKLFGRKTDSDRSKDGGIAGKPQCFDMPKGAELKRILAVKEQNRGALRNKLRDGEKIVVCLFVCRISCWFFDDLYKKLDESGVFIPYIVVKPFMTMGKDAMVDYMDSTFDALTARGYRVIKTYDKETESFLDIKETLNPDVVFYTKYWPPQFRSEYYINRFMDKLTFFVPYAFDIGRHNVVYDFDLLNNVDRFLYNTPIHKEMAEKYMPNHGKNVYVVGAPKLDVFFDPSYAPKDVWKEQPKKKKRIIWAPHHEDQTKEDMYQFDSFYYIADYMFEIAEKYKDEIQIAFKPHPMLKPKLDYRWGKQSADEYYEKWANLENGQLELGEFQDLFLTSDAMILDSVSFIAEYMAVDKPALFTVSPTSRVMFNEFGEMAYEELYHTEGETLKEDIDSFVKKVVIRGVDPKAQSRTAFVKEYIAPPNGKTATENIYESILDEIQNGDKK
ncbi:MAG: CDP-glycerol glycerophosphotransferase family protein [Clostridia bacterium]|nr:CDP-glycerol glycerophosphotransferase family protein [Clostridia bacterium]